MSPRRSTATIEPASKFGIAGEVDVVGLDEVASIIKRKKMFLYSGGRTSPSRSGPIRAPSDACCARPSRAWERARGKRSPDQVVELRKRFDTWKTIEDKARAEKEQPIEKKAAPKKAKAKK